MKYSACPWCPVTCSNILVDSFPLVSTKKRLFFWVVWCKLPRQFMRDFAVFSPSAKGNDYFGSVTNLPGQVFVHTSQVTTMIGQKKNRFFFLFVVFCSICLFFPPSSGRLMSSPEWLRTIFQTGPSHRNRVRRSRGSLWIRGVPRVRKSGVRQICSRAPGACLDEPLLTAGKAAAGTKVKPAG